MASVPLMLGALGTYFKDESGHSFDWVSEFLNLNDIRNENVNIIINV